MSGHKSGQPNRGPEFEGLVEYASQFVVKNSDRLRSATPLNINIPAMAHPEIRRASIGEIISGVDGRLHELVISEGLRPNFRLSHKGSHETPDGTIVHNVLMDPLFKIYQRNRSVLDLTAAVVPYTELVSLMGCVNEGLPPGFKRKSS